MLFLHAKMTSKFIRKEIYINSIDNATFNSIFSGTTGSSELKFELYLIEPYELHFIEI